MLGSLCFYSYTAGSLYNALRTPIRYSAQRSCGLKLQHSNPCHAFRTKVIEAGGEYHKNFASQEFFIKNSNFEKSRCEGLLKASRFFTPTFSFAMDVIRRKLSCFWR